MPFLSRAHTGDGLRGILTPKICLPRFFDSFRVSFPAFKRGNSLANKFIALFFAKVSHSLAFDCFRRGFISDTSARFTASRLTNSGPRFWRGFSPYSCGSRLFDGFSGIFHSQIRASGGRNVEVWIECINPTLFTHRQCIREEYQFYNFKGKRLLSILVPCPLQLWILVSIVPEFAEMARFTSAQMNGAANVKLTRNHADNAVDARRSGNRRGIIHDDRNCLSFLALFSCCQGGKATASLHREATPVLGNISTIPFSARGQKAEVFAKEVA